MRIIKLAFFLFIFLYSAFSYSHTFNTRASGCSKNTGGTYVFAGHAHGISRVISSSTCEFSDSGGSDPNSGDSSPDSPDDCASGERLITINDNPSFCSPASDYDISLSIHSAGGGISGTNIKTSEYDSGDVNFTTDNPVTNEETGLVDLTNTAPESQPFNYIPFASNPTESSTSTSSTTTQGDLTTNTTQSTTTNNVDNTRTINTTNTTTNNVTGDTTINNIVTRVNPDGSVSETQSTDETSSDELAQGKVSGGSSCSAPPTRAGEVSDAEFNTILQNYYIRCPRTELTNNDSQGFGDEYQASLDVAETELSDLLTTIQDEFDSQFAIDFSGGSSINPNVHTIKGASVDFSLSKFVSFFVYLGYVIIFMSYFYAFNIIMER